MLMLGAILCPPATWALLCMALDSLVAAGTNVGGSTILESTDVDAEADADAGCSPGAGGVAPSVMGGFTWTAVVGLRDKHILHLDTHAGVSSDTVSGSRVPHTEQGPISVQHQ